jgi:hypothetical protein
MWTGNKWVMWVPPWLTPWRRERSSRLLFFLYHSRLC